MLIKNKVLLKSSYLMQNIFIDCFAYLFIFLQKILGKYIVLRLGYARTDRIGELILQFLVYKKSNKNFDIWFFHNDRCNTFLCLKIIKSEKLFLWPFNPKIFHKIYRLNLRQKKLDHLVLSPGVDVWNKNPAPKFLLDIKKEKKCLSSFLINNGLNKKSKYFCLHVRDEKYLSNKEGKKSEDGHCFRNSNIQKYKKSVKFLISKKIHVFRLGKDQEEPLNIKSPFFHDYAFSSQRSDKIDILLSANCNGFISTGSGLDFICCPLKIPILFTNYFPIFYLPTYFPKNMVLPKKYWDLKNKAYLSLRQMVSRNLFQVSLKNDIIARNIRIDQNSSKEIFQSTKNFYNLFFNRKRLSKGDLENQAKFWGKFPMHLKDPATQHPLHGKQNSFLCPSFLKANEWIIN